MNFEKIINEAWEQKETITKTSHPDVVKAIKSTIDQVDQGIIRVAEKKAVNGLSINGSKKQFC